MKKIIIRGARVHNLKNINLDIPRDKLVVITGLSGSGKSSLAFDTIFAEGQRRYIESLSSYARQFLGMINKPEVDKIDGLSPAISIDQKSVSKNPRSTVGTITEIYDYLRILFARIGKPFCPICGQSVGRQTVDQITQAVFDLKNGSNIMILAPVIRGKKGEHRAVLEEIKNSGFRRLRINQNIMMIEEAMEMKLDAKKKQTIETVVDRILIDKNLDRARVADSIETALKIGKGILILKNNEEEKSFSQNLSCVDCAFSFPEIEPRFFSFNSPYGACASCTGLGSKLEINPNLLIVNPNLTLAEGALKPFYSLMNFTWQNNSPWQNWENTPWKDLPNKIKNTVFEFVVPYLENRWKETESEWMRKEIEKYMKIKNCAACLGQRLKKESLAVKIEKKSIADIAAMSILEAKKFFEKLLKKNSQEKINKKIAEPIVKEILNRLNFLSDVGLDYLTLKRESQTLSGGEAQRIRLATQIGSRLTGVLYILDEPSIGLHARDHSKLIKTLKSLRDLGNTVLVVEHDEQTMREADWIIDLGPGAGNKGGYVMAEGSIKKIMKTKTPTGLYLAGKNQIPIREKPRDGNGNYLMIKKASANNLKKINLKIPLGKFVAVSGVSGSGKSTLVNNILARSLLKQFYKATAEPGNHEKIEGVQNIDKAINIDQSPIGRTPRSNPATYTGIFTHIRDLFAKTMEAKIRGYGPGRFSFNVKGGRCETCEGHGWKKIEMYFLPDVFVECSECQGKRYNQEALKVEYDGKNIAEVLDMPVEEALKFFKNIPGLKDKLETLNRVGLGYIKLGQAATTLSGGEAQRIKLATELSRRDTGQTLYILDEPTTGLHFEDIRKLLGVLNELADKGNTILVIEHNLDVLKSADWIIDLGPEGGELGGYIVAEGTPNQIANRKKSYTGRYLKKYFSRA
ncbi:MAG: excinuclease ABC subunit UvrA [Parcubacteria group bacterium]|nr:excinuclease ABC subunit UvrA [Parcubacteria group bacterium]